MPETEEELNDSLTVNLTGESGTFQTTKKENEGVNKFNPQKKLHFTKIDCNFRKSRKSLILITQSSRE